MYIGVDIGGTKCAAVFADGECNILDKLVIPTDTHIGVEHSLKNLFQTIEKLIGKRTIKAIGISCGGPLCSETGMILSPPNLPGWDNVPIVRLLAERFEAPAFLQNDADACALAEWKLGAGKGYNNVIFLTFGTGIGAGLILGGRLYTGGCNMAGEIGHIRLNNGNHVGYNKKGSFEGYCSGGGIAQYGYGTAAEVAQKAYEGDSKAIEIFNEVGANLGKGLSILIDILNPDVIVLGSIYTRARDLMYSHMKAVIDKEALEKSRNHCKILKAELGESLGDIASVCVAINGIKMEP